MAACNDGLAGDNEPNNRRSLAVKDAYMGTWLLVNHDLSKGDYMGPAV